jgi:hypothetical protein
VLKALAEDEVGEPVIVIGLPASVLAQLAEGGECWFDLAEMSMPDVHIRLEGGADDESIVRDWAARGVLPPGVALEITTQIQAARAAGISGRAVYDPQSQLDQPQGDRP